MSMQQLLPATAHSAQVSDAQKSRAAKVRSWIVGNTTQVFDKITPSSPRQARVPVADTGIRTPSETSSVDFNAIDFDARIAALKETPQHKTQEFLTDLEKQTLHPLDQQYLRLSRVQDSLDQKGELTAENQTQISILKRVLYKSALAEWQAASEQSLLDAPVFSVLSDPEFAVETVIPESDPTLLPNPSAEQAVEDHVINSAVANSDKTQTLSKADSAQVHDPIKSSLALLRTERGRELVREALFFKHKIKPWLDAASFVPGLDRLVATYKLKRLAGLDDKLRELITTRAEDSFPASLSTLSSTPAAYNRSLPLNDNITIRSATSKLEVHDIVISNYLLAVVR